MNFEIKRGDVVVVRNRNNEEFPAWVQRLTKTQIITQGLQREYVTRYSLETGTDLSSRYSRWDRRSCIVRLATPEQAQEHIAQVKAGWARIDKYNEMAGLFKGLPVTDGPRLKDGEWKVQLEFAGLSEDRLRELAAKLAALCAELERV